MANNPAGAKESSALPEKRILITNRTMNMNIEILKLYIMPPNLTIALLKEESLISDFS